MICQQIPLKKRIDDTDDIYKNETYDFYSLMCEIIKMNDWLREMRMRMLLNEIGEEIAKLSITQNQDVRLD